MSVALARIIFLAAVILNALLWSASRYSHPALTKSLQHGNPALVRRISYELLNPGAAQLLNGEEDECHPKSVPTRLQCAHVEESCPFGSTFLGINYLQNYFCAKPALRPLIFTGLVVWIIFLFSTLGISASDFFTPNLASIANLLGLDENVAGVTFLAFGNGSPDLFSTLSAMRADSGSLAIGELLGAASFIVSCVVGSMCIIKPFRVHRWPFLRDVGFFTVAVILVLVILYDGQIRMVESGMLIGLYMLYVLVVVVGSWWEKRQERKRLLEDLIRGEYDNNLAAFPPYQDEPSPSSSNNNLLSVPANVSGPNNLPVRARAISSPTPLHHNNLRIQTNVTPRSRSRSPSPNRLAQLPSFSLVGALEFRDIIASLERQSAGSSMKLFESPITPYAGGHYHARYPSKGSLSRAHSIHGVSPRSGVGEREDEESGMSRSLQLEARPSRPALLLTPPAPVPEEPVSDFSGLRGEEHEQEDGYFATSHHLAGSTVSVPTILRTPASPPSSDSSDIFTPPTKSQKARTLFKEVLHTLFPTFHHFSEQSLLSKIAVISAAPPVLLLTLTLPVVVTRHDEDAGRREKPEQYGNGRSAEERLVDFEEEGVERLLIAEEEVEESMHELKYSPWLMAVQFILGPLFCAGVLFRDNRYEPWILLAASVIGMAMAVLVLVFAKDGLHPTLRMTRCSMGFVVAIVWIMAIADEVVNVLETFGEIFGLSDAILGLTVFAIGNSLADLVANTSVAVFAPIMGFSACFGGPMLNILLGVGLSGTYVIHATQKPYYIALSPTLLVSSIGLLMLLVATLVVVPLNNYFLTRKWGAVLIAAYTVIMVTNIVVEVRGLR